jgi:hypothetical protein
MMSQFTCEVCGDGFDQKSRLERHIATSHPERAPSAADIEKALAGIQYPRTKEGLISFSLSKVSDTNLLNLINSLPDRTYRDSAEVAVALGELKKREIKTVEEVIQAEQPSRRGGRAAAASVSAAAVAKILSRVDFPKSKSDLKDYAAKHASEAGVRDSGAILDVIDQLPDRQYQNMADVEKSVGSVL